MCPEMRDRHRRQPALSCLPHLRPPNTTLFPYTTLFRSCCHRSSSGTRKVTTCGSGNARHRSNVARRRRRSEEHTSELQSRVDLVCRLLLEKKKLEQHIVI